VVARFAVTSTGVGSARVGAAAARLHPMELQAVAIQGAFVLGHDGVAAVAASAGHFEGDLVAVHLTVADFLSRRRSAVATAAAHAAGHRSGELGAIGLQGEGRGDGHRIATIPARHRTIKGPLAAHIRRHSEECDRKQNCGYKKQLLGHSAWEGVWRGSRRYP
jgi:hypothetical protein